MNTPLDGNYNELLEIHDARAFLRRALEVRYRKKGKINLADFSRRAGFSSRSFLSEYLAGKKGLSKESVGQLKTALKLPKPYLELFSLLVGKDQPELLTKKLTHDDIHKKVHSIKVSVARQAEALTQIKDPNRLITRPTLFRVFAALGTEDEGANLNEIVARTNLSSESVVDSLHVLINEGAITSREGRFYVRSHQIDFLKLSEPMVLADLTRTLCNQIKVDASTIAADTKNSLFYTAFSIQSHQLPEFKEKLREAILSVLDQYQDDKGDTVHEVFLCGKS
ncbi:hypothetical protein QJS83_17345 [Bdellovibrio sp. 22V]|uniref:hypothetical protein n=1 Tax=Bdellovibrio TaxID=958 RepID=UPI002543E35E|nr:hypothetical protein [Bdellovibrio sp. 22V]WII72231.1 hypothetical protein QJS83_17345 [Bdellovibrio sp. 22V]